MIKENLMPNGSQKTPQGFAVELYFDANTEKSIFAFRDGFYNEGIKPVLGSLGDRPHISLAVFAEIDQACLKDLTQEFAAKLSGFPVELSAIGTFPTQDNVLFLIPVPTIKLLEVHRDFHRQLKCAAIRSSSYYHPGKWIPHCTIELDLPDKQFTKALKIVHQLFQPIKGEFSSLGIVSFRPINYISEHKFKKEV
jgi:2'-5' RNA ligase